jgi:DNA-binding transcriptional regulator YdaS (Cro superfamily)
MGVTPSFLTQLTTSKNRRPIPIKRCVQIEICTGGRVTRQEMRADWREIWPELAAMEAAAGASRAVHRLTRRNASKGYLTFLSPLQIQPRIRGQRRQENRRPFMKQTRIASPLLICSVERTKGQIHPRFKEIRL